MANPAADIAVEMETMKIGHQVGKNVTSLVRKS